MKYLHLLMVLCFPFSLAIAMEEPIHEKVVVEQHTANAPTSEEGTSDAGSGETSNPDQESK